MIERRAQERVEINQPAMLSGPRSALFSGFTRGRDFTRRVPFAGFDNAKSWGVESKDRTRLPDLADPIG